MRSQHMPHSNPHPRCHAGKCFRGRPSARITLSAAGYRGEVQCGARQWNIANLTNHAVSWHHVQHPTEPTSRWLWTPPGARSPHFGGGPVSHGSTIYRTAVLGLLARSGFYRLWGWVDEVTGTHNETRFDQSCLSCIPRSVDREKRSRLSELSSNREGEWHNYSQGRGNTSCLTSGHESQASWSGER